MIRISLKGLAKFMTAGAAAQRKILRDFKYPDPEGRAQAMYYREARDFIKAYHKHNRESSWLMEKSENLSLLSKAAVDQTKTRLAHNSRALREYERHFGEKEYEILEDLKLELIFSGVKISVYPDLHVREKDKEKIVKLEFSVEQPDAQIIKIISQAMFESASNHGLNLPSRNVIYLDVPRNTAYKGARVGARMRREIEAACENIKAIWDSI